VALEAAPPAYTSDTAELGQDCAGYGVTIDMDGDTSPTTAN
jgi:hypothetical protein